MLVCRWVRPRDPRHSSRRCPANAVPCQRRIARLPSFVVPHVLSRRIRSRRAERLSEMRVPRPVRRRPVSRWLVVPTARGHLFDGSMSTNSHVQEGALAERSVPGRSSVDHWGHSATIPVWPWSRQTDVSAHIQMLGAIRQRLRRLLSFIGRSTLRQAGHLSTVGWRAHHGVGWHFVWIALRWRHGMSANGKVLPDQRMRHELQTTR